MLNQNQYMWCQARTILLIFIFFIIFLYLKAGYSIVINLCHSKYFLYHFITFKYIKNKHVKLSSILFDLKETFKLLYCSKVIYLCFYVFRKK